jgi:Putative metallopeptidase
MLSAMNKFAAVPLLFLTCCMPAFAGRFVVQPALVDSAEARTEAREMESLGLLQDIADALNSVVTLPRDVGLRYAECGEANAYYDADERHILMCIELMEDIADTVEGQFETEDEAAEAAAGAWLAVALHEAGHAMVDVLELPVTGREEDAVDQLAAWILIESDDVDSVLGAAASYYTEDEAEDSDFADEHSLNRQRYFNLVCWAYGSDPENGQELIDTWELPEARAEGCAAEYAQLDRSWSRLLRDHLRADAAAEDDEPRPTVQRPPPREEETVITATKKKY